MAPQVEVPTEVPFVGGNLPEGWRLARLAEVATYTMGRTPPRKSPEYWAGGGGIPWVTIADMSPFVAVKATAESVSQAAAREIFQASPVARGTLLMSFKLTIGRTAILDIDAYHNEAIIAIQPGSQIDRAFLRFYLPTIDFTFHQDRAVKGQTLNRGKIDALPVVVPPLAEQRGIAALLEALLERLDVQRNIVIALRTLKAATMAKVFREGLRGEPVKQTTIGEIPESWRVSPLGDHCTIRSGGTPARDVAEYWGGGIPWVKTGEINYRSIQITGEHITRAGLENSSAQVFPKGTLLMAMYGQGVTRGRVAMLDIPSATNQACAALTPGPQLDVDYLYAFCCFAYDRIRDVAHGANQKKLSADLIRQILLPLPPDLSEQRDISTAVSAIDASFALAEQRQASLVTLFSSMLNVLMTGQVRVPPGLIGQALARLEGKLSPEVIEEIVRRIVGAIAPEKIVLFGSAARGQMGPDSDLDLLVVKPCNDRREVARAVRACLRGVAPGRGKDVVVVTPEDVERDRDTIGYIIRPALRDGRVLYAA